MLQVEGLNAGYGGSWVLDGLALSVPRGQVTAILGRNGMGKTTFMRALMGLLPVDSGRVLFDKQDITGLRPFEVAKRGIAYVPQGREVFADFTVLENLRLGLLGAGNAGAEIPDEIFERFPILLERRNQKGGTLSGGQQQQLAIARALIGQPKLLLLDEPSEGIQPSIVMEIAENLQRISEDEGLTVLLVEQNVQMVLSIASQCTFIENGRVAAQHGADDLRADPGIVQRYLAV